LENNITYEKNTITYIDIFLNKIIVVDGKMKLGKFIEEQKEKHIIGY